MLVMIQRICAALDKVSLGRVAVLKRSVTTVAIPPALVRRHSHGMPIRKRFSRDTRTTWAHNLDSKQSFRRMLDPVTLDQSTSRPV